MESRKETLRKTRSRLGPISPGDGEFQEAGKKGKSKKLTKQTKSKQDISHLLGFSVQGQGVNRGELDMPQ